MLYLSLLVMLIARFPLPSVAQDTYQIEINKVTNTLYLYKNNILFKQYRVATGKTPDLTPEGTFTIIRKVEKPSWHNREKNEVIPGGTPRNPLGERWNGLSIGGGTEYGIHGTNRPKSIGKNISHGCIRMYNKSVIELYNYIAIGTPVWIHHQPSDKHWKGIPRGTIQITADRVNARAGPSTDYTILYNLRKGIRLTQTGGSNNWIQVELPNKQTAFVRQDFTKPIT